MVQDDKVIPLIKYMPNPKPTKKAEGGRIHAQAGLFTGLGKALQSVVLDEIVKQQRPGGLLYTQN